MEISIHALLAESDLEPGTGTPTILHFYPRSPCGERLSRASRLRRLSEFLSTLSLRRATIGMFNRPHSQKFLSTLSLRRATHIHAPSQRPYHYFYPRSPCGERPRILLGLAFHKHFYPRSPCGERHKIPNQRKIDQKNFYPRSPCGERRKIKSSSTIKVYFYPRSPCGERLFNAVQIVIVVVFLSTLSLRRATLII